VPPPRFDWPEGSHVPPNVRREIEAQHREPERERQLAVLDAENGRLRAEKADLERRVSKLERLVTRTIDHCLFSNIHIPGENESFTIKQHGWIVRFCTFLNVGEELTFRTTNDTEVRSCWFENTPTRTIRCFGENHLIIGNRVVGGGDFIIACGNATMAEILSGAEPIDSYARTRNCRIIGNTMGSGRIIVGGYNPSQTPGNPIEYPALNNILQANRRTSGPPAHTLVNTILGFSPAQTGTTVSATTSAPFVPAVRLTSADVGLNAPDPLCD
jgi:hypothetical protein